MSDRAPALGVLKRALRKGTLRSTPMTALVLAIVAALITPATAQVLLSPQRAFEQICVASTERQASPSELAGESGLTVLQTPAPALGVAPSTPLSRVWGNLANASDPTAYYIVTAVIPPPNTHFSCMLAVPNTTAEETLSGLSVALEGRGYVLNSEQSNDRAGVSSQKYDRQISDGLVSVLLVTDRREGRNSFRAISYCAGCPIPRDGRAIN